MQKLEAKNKPAETAETKPAEEERQPNVNPDGTPAVDQPGGPTNKGLKAPQSWTPAAREKFATLPREVQQEVARRETEISNRLNETAADRKLAQEFKSVVAPFEEKFRAANVNPIELTRGFLQAADVLNHGDAKSKARLIAQLIKTHNITESDVGDALDSFQNAPAVDPALQERLNRMEQMLTAREQEIQQTEAARINSVIDSFASDPKNEFFSDVVGHMQALLSSGQAQDLQDAYDQACWANPAVRKVLVDRKSSDKARLNAGSASLKTNGPKGPRKAPAPTGGSIRDILDKAIPLDE